MFTLTTLHRIKFYTVTLVHYSMSSTNTEPADKRMLGAKVDPSLHRRVRIEAAKRDMTVSDYIREVLDNNTPDC